MQNPLSELSLKAQAILFIIGFLLMMTATQLYFITPMLEESDIEEFVESQARLTEQIANNINSALSQTIREIKAISEFPGLVPIDGKEADAILTKMDQVTQHFNYFFLTDVDGVWKSYPKRPHLVGKKITNTQWIKETIASRDIHFIDVLYADAIDQLVSGFSSPVFSQNDEVIGVLRGVTTISQDNAFLQMIKDVTVGLKGYAFIVDSKARVLAHPQQDLSPKHFSDQQVLQYPPVKEALSGKSGSLEYTEGGTTWLSTYQHIPVTGWGLILQLPKEEVSEHVYEEVKSLNIVYLTIFLIGFFILALLSQLALRPLSLLLKNIRGERLSSKVIYSKNEIGEIAQEINTLFTNQKEAELALKESEERFRQLAENITEVFYISNLQTHQMLYISPAYELIWGQSCESLYSNPFSFVEAIHPDYREHVTHLLDRQLLGEKTEEVYPIIRPDQSMRWIRDRAFPVTDDDGNVVRVIGIAEDITYQKESEETIRESEEHYQSLLDISPDAIVETGLDGKIIYCNQQAAIMHGYNSPAEMVGQDSLQSMFEEDIHIAQNNAALLLDKGNFRNSTFRMRKKDGTPVPVEVSASLLRNADGTPKSFIGYIRDISEHREAEDKQKRLSNELLIKNKELEQMLYVTSHDLRSPLVNVEGYSRELEYSLKDLMSSIDHADGPSNIKDKITSILKEDVPESLHYIRTSVLKMNTLLKGILTLSRVGRSILMIEDIDMNEMMSDIVDSHRFRLNDLSIKTEVSELPDCKGDSSQINQVFSNLLDNAIKYKDSERSCVIHISGHKDKDQSVYCIEDNGIGIAPAHQDKIFEIFHQLEPNRVQGEGIGLTIATKIIDKHNGKLWLESELGKGSKFFVSLPS